MKRYRVIVTPDAEEDLSARLGYLLNVKKNPQAYDNVLEDYFETIDALETAAGILKLCEDSDRKRQNNGVWNDTITSATL